MSNNEFSIGLVGSLQWTKTKNQLNTDIRQLEKAINMLRITGMFAKRDTKKELNQYIKELGEKLSYVKLKGKLNEKSLKREIDKSLHNMTFKEIDALNIDGGKAKLKIRKVVADMKAYAEKTPISVNVSLKKEKLSNDLTSFLNKNSKIKESGVLLAESERIRELIDSVDDKGTLRNATDAFSLFKSEVSATGYAGKSTAQKIKDMLTHITKIGSFFGLASLAVNNFTKSLKTLRSNDTILTEISKSSEMVKSQLEKLGDESFKVASKYGQLSSSYLLGVQEMSRAGYENADSMAELSTKVQGAGDMTAELANQYIIATDKAYKLNGSIGALNTVLDGANNITNNNALTMSDLGEAMSIVGSQAASSGMKVNEITAALSTMIAVTQQGGSQMANAFKGILMNLRQVSGEVEDGGDIIDAESLTKYEKACNELGVSLSTVKDGVVSLREPMQIIKELSEAYVRLDEADSRRANLLSAVGGKYRANALNAILENYDLYEKMLQDYADGLGSMDKEAEKTAKSWEGRLNSLQNSFDSFVNTLINKKAILGGISFFDRMIQGAEELTNAIGEIPVVLTTLNTAMVAMNKNYGITSIKNEETGKLDIQGNLFGIDFSAIKQQKKHFKEAKEFISKWNKELLKGKVYIDDFSDSVVKNNAQFKDYLSTCKDASASLKGYKAYLNQMGISTDALRIKTIAMNAALSLGLGIVAQVVMKVFQSIGTTVDDYLHKLERQQEKLEDALSAYEDVKSELDGINSELDENKKKIEELEAKDKLTYAEKGQLEELKQITEQLELQKEISEWQLGNRQKDAAMESVAYINAKYNLGNSNIKDVDGLIPNILSDDHRSLDIAEDIDVTDAEYLAAAYRAVSGELENLIDKRKELSNDSQDAKFVDNDIETYKSSVEDVKTEINDMLSSLMEQKANIQDYFDTIKDTPYDDMSTDARNCYNTMKQINASIQTLYYGLGNNRFNSEAIDEIFNTEGIELTKEKLIEMAQAGTLNPAVIASHEKLADAILNSNLVADEGCGLFKTLCNEIYALVSAEEKAAGMSKHLSITETVDQINTQLKPAFDSLKSAYKDIFTDDGFALDSIDIISTCDSIKSKLDDMAELGLSIDYSSYEDFVRVLRDSESDTADVQDAFNNLATAITDAGVNGLEDFETLKAALEDLGVVNNEIVAFQELCQNTEALKEAGLDLANATESEIEEFVNETVSAENCSQALAYLELCKLLVNNARVETQEDINRILSLAKTAGIGAEALAKLANFKTALENETDPKIRQWIIKSINAYTKTLASEIETVQVGVDFTPKTDTSKTSGSKSSSSAKDTTDTFDWIQQAIENVEKEVKDLDDIVNSAYSTFSQKNDALAKEIGKVSEEIDLQQQAYDEYMRKADSIGLSDHYRELVQNGTIGIEDIADESLQNMIDEYQKWYDKAMDASNAIKDLKTDMKDLYVSAYELQTDNLKDRLDSNSITEKQYLDELKATYEKFYADLEDFAQQYHEAVLDYLDKEKDYLNSVASAAASLLDREIDNIRDDADAQESSLKRQIDLLEAKKKPLQDELDALEDKARKEELIYNLQKAQYALARAENQRTKLIYIEEKGMIYTSDPTAIRDAKKDVDDAKLEIQKQSIQDQIDALDDEIDRYNDLIDQINKAADERIDALEREKNKWQEVIDQQEYAQNLLLLTGEFGADAITKILTGNDDDLLEQWKNSYINTLADIDMESQGHIGNMTEQLASLYDVDLSPLQDQFQGVSDSVSGMTDALSEAANAIGIGNVSDNAASPNAPEGTSAPSTGTESSLESAIKSETDTAMASFDQHTDKLTNEVIPAIQSATAEMIAFNEAADMDIEKTVTISYVAMGDKPSANKGNAGTSHVEGTAKVSGDWAVQSDESNALVGELGRELIVRNGRFFTVGDNGAEMTDIKKGDIVFNHEQTEELLKNGRISGHGKAYADGTVGGGKILTSDGHILRPLQPGDRGWDLMQAGQAFIDKWKASGEEFISNAYFEGQKQLEKWTKVITNNTAINNVTNNKNVQPVINQEIHVTLPNVTNSTSAEALLRDLQSINIKKFQVFG